MNFSRASVEFEMSISYVLDNEPPETLDACRERIRNMQAIIRELTAQSTPSWNAAVTRAAEICDYYAELMKSEGCQRAATQILSLLLPLPTPENLGLKSRDDHVLEYVRQIEILHDIAKSKNHLFECENAVLLTAEAILHKQKEPLRSELVKRFLDRARKDVL